MKPVYPFNQILTRFWHTINFNNLSIPKCLLVFSLVIVCPNTKASDLWQVDQAKSSLTFKAIQEGNEIEGRFDRFEARLAFDNNNLEQSYFEVSVDLNTVNTDVPERDELLRSADFFKIISWPTASFKTIKINPVKDNHYRADALLGIRNVSLPIQFDFTVIIKQEDGHKILIGEGSTMLDRFDFDMAHGDFTGTDTVGAKVRVIAKIRAVQAH